MSNIFQKRNKVIWRKKISPYLARKNNRNEKSGINGDYLKSLLCLSPLECSLQGEKHFISEKGKEHLYSHTQIPDFNP